MYLRSIINEVHINFKEHVMKYREHKISKEKDELNKILNADIFHGEEAKKFGYY
jgi:ClpP class serine protease